MTKQRGLLVAKKNKNLSQPLRVKELLNGS